jgi:hypothetical protein
MSDEKERMEKAIREILERFGDTDPPWPELLGELSEKYGLPEEAIEKAWRLTTFKGR